MFISAKIKSFKEVSGKSLLEVTIKYVQSNGRTVLVVSTATGAEPYNIVKRWSKTENKEIEVLCPNTLKCTIRIWVALIRVINGWNATVRG